MLQHEERRDLSGTWDFLPGALKADNAFDRLNPDSALPWTPVVVPACWNGSRWMSIVGEPYATDGFAAGAPAWREHPGVGWYRTSFTVPPAWANRRVHIRFQAVAARAKVWLNGAFIGEHLGAYASFTLELTGHVKHGAENRLVVQVWGKRCFYPDDERRFNEGGIHLFVPGRTVDVPVGESRDNAGIWQPVELFATGPAFVEHFDVRTELEDAGPAEPRRGRLQARVAVERAAGERTAVDVTLALVERATDRVVHEETKRSHLPDERTVLTYRWPSLAVAAWSPESPTLYELRLAVGHDGERWQASRLALGFRRFEIRDGAFHLNGDPCFLRGAGTPAHPLVPCDVEYIDRFLGLCKAANLNCIRFHTEPPSAAWLDGCDRAGLLVLYEFALMQQAPEVGATRREIRDLVRQSKHHPCLALYCLSNETDFLPGLAGMAGYPSMREYLADLGAAVLEEDASLPVYHNAGYSWHEDGDVRDWHIYGGWYDNSIYSYEAIMRGQPMMEALSPREGEPMAPGGLVDRRNRKFRVDMHKPVILTEFVAAYTADDGHLFQYPLRVRRIGRYPDPGNARALWFQAHLLRETVEIMRRSRDGTNRLCGLMPFALFNWFFHPLETDRLAPKPALAALRDAVEPLHLGIRCWSRHRFGTDALSAELFLIHDDVTRRRVDAGEMAWRVVTGDGVVVVEGRVGAPGVSYYEIARVPLEVMLPDIPGDQIVSARLEVEWRSNGAPVSRNTVDLLLAPARLREARRSEHARVWLVDAGERAASVLAALGTTCRRHAELPLSADGIDLLVVGPDMLPRLGHEDTKRLRALAMAGLTVLVLEQDVYHPDRQPIVIDWVDGTLLRIMREDDHVDDFVYLPDPGSPIFAGLEPEHFRMWNGNTVIVSSYLRQGDESNHRPAKTRFGSRSGYSVRKLEQVKSWAECFNFLRDDALIEVPLGAGRVVFSQLEATRRFGDDPVATVYLGNLLRYCLVPRSQRTPAR